jgi:Domain of unknown function (DUF4136)
MAMQVRTLILGGLLAVASFATTGAQKLDIETHRDPKADFTTVKTYAWLPPVPVIPDRPPDAVSDPTLSQDALRPHLIAAVDQQLAARGLTQTDQASADVHVASYALLTSNVSQTYVGEYYGYVTGWGSPIAPGLAPSTSSTIYQKGTVVIDLVQRATNRAIWRAVVSARIDQERTLKQRVERVNKAVDRMFEKFPIARAKE